MTNFALVTSAPVISSLASGEKGSLGNRVDCAAAQVGNNIKAAAMAAGVLGTSYALTKNPKAASALETGLRKGSKFVLNMGVKAGKYISKTKAGRVIINNFKKLGKLPVLGKIAKFTHEGANSFRTLAAKYPPLASLGLATLTLIGVNRYYKSGQIDQKYTDRANSQKIAK